MSYLSIATGNMVKVPAGVLNAGRWAEAKTVPIAAFALQDSAVTVAQWRAFQREYADRPYACFQWVPFDYFRVTHMGQSPADAKKITEALIGKKVVPTQEEYEDRFEGYDAGLRELLLLDDHPVVKVNWYEAAAYAASIGGRLPTREEREYATRCGREGDVYGTDDGKLRADNAHWSPEGHPRKKGTARVRSYSPTPWGHYDLAGNVCELVALKGALQGWCGGSWNTFTPMVAAGCGSGFGFNNDTCLFDLGFRVALSIPQDSK